MAFLMTARTKLLIAFGTVNVSSASESSSLAGDEQESMVELTD
jgi:hypothetical protein